MFKRILTGYYTLFTENPLSLALALGIIIRLSVIATSDFPINDGGMFYTMTQELIKNSFRLPVVTNYNFLNIPFAYPPFGFYFAGFLSTLTKIELFQVFRYVPLLNTILAIPVVYFVAKDLFSKRIAFLSALVFAILPRSFEWEIMGGGITRSFGMLFYLLTVLSITAPNGKKTIREIYPTILFFSLTLLSHLEWFALAAVTLFVFEYRRNFKHLMIVVLVSMFLTSFWWGTVIKHHGISPFINFFGNGVTPLKLLTNLEIMLLRLTDEPFLTIIGVLCLLGLIFQSIKKQFLLPTLFFLPIIFTQRGSPNMIVLPLSLLAGIGMNLFYKLLLAYKVTPKNGIMALSFFFLYSFASTIMLISLKDIFAYYFDSLSYNHRQAMTWAKNNTPTGSKYLLITNHPGVSWSTDVVSEWFPTISERKSITTPQATEWLPGNHFERMEEFQIKVKECYQNSWTCIENVTRKEVEVFDFVYVETDSAENSRTSLISYQIFQNPEYKIVYKNQEVAIYQKK